LLIVARPPQIFKRPVQCPAAIFEEAGVILDCRAAIFLLAGVICQFPGRTFSSGRRDL
jgi:hypothetical protein